MNYRLVDQTLHFIRSWRYREEGGWSWRMWIYGWPITGRGVYIRGMECREFYNVYIREPFVLIYHWMILV